MHVAAMNVIRDTRALLTIRSGKTRVTLIKREYGTPAEIKKELSKIFQRCKHDPDILGDAPSLSLLLDDKAWQAVDPLGGTLNPQTISWFMLLALGTETATLVTSAHYSPDTLLPRIDPKPQ